MIGNNGIKKVEFILRGLPGSILVIHQFSEKAKKETKTTLVHVKIKRFSQAGNYESWWRVGVAEVSTMPKVKAAREKMDANMKTVRKY